MALILLRHTTPDIDEGVCYGQTDLDVLATFEREAENALAALPPFQQIISSPLVRCRKLAEFIADRTGLSVQRDERLMEMNFGNWEGQPWSDIPRAEIDAWASDFIHASPHGGESVAMLRRRVHRALSDIARTEKPSLVVTHSGVMRAALSKGDGFADFEAKIDFGGHVTISDVEGVTHE
ncbi:MAG: alpha-ribazole phosphatase [Pseudomonadota bacterium]